MTRNSRCPRCHHLMSRHTAGGCAMPGCVCTNKSKSTPRSRSKGGWW